MASRPLSRRLLLASGSATALHMATTALGPALAGCDGATTGERVSYETTAGSDVLAGEAFETVLGWTVTLDEAWVCLGYLRYAEGGPIAAGPSPRSVPHRVPQRLANLLLPEAHAHPGHYDEGATIGEMRTAQLVELLGAPRSLGVEPGVSGDGRSALVRFHIDDSLSAPRPEAVALVAGVATRADLTRRFVAVATREGVLHSATTQPEIAGCPLDGAPMDVDGVVHLEVRLRLWLDQVDFELVGAPANGDDEVELAVGEPAHNAFLRGVKKAAAYHFRYEPV